MLCLSDQHLENTEHCTQSAPCSGDRDIIIRNWRIVV